MIFPDAIDPISGFIVVAGVTSALVGVLPLLTTGHRGAPVVSSGGWPVVAAKLCNMNQIVSGVRRLRHAADSGQLAELARRYRLELITLFGSSRSRPKSAGDIDIAYLPAFNPADSQDSSRTQTATGSKSSRSLPTHVQLMIDVEELTGCDQIDLMNLKRATPVALFAALAHGEPLYESQRGIFANQQIQAMGIFRDTAHFRDLALRMWAA